MGEKAAIERVSEPVTTDSLVADLRDLGVEAGGTLLVHASLSSLGWVAGGPQAVVDALREVVTPEGTLVMPTHTTQYSDPAGWSNPPVPDDWVEKIHEAMPPYRPDVTPTRGMGAIPECFRTYPDVRRSDHPEVSFAAWGSETERVVGDHPLADSLGDESPLGAVYELDGDVLLLGVDHSVNTSLHLAEYRADVGADRVECPVVVEENGQRVQRTYTDIETSTDDFDALGADFEATVGLETGTVGAAEARLASQRDLVDFAVGWLEDHR